MSRLQNSRNRQTHFLRHESINYALDKTIHQEVTSLLVKFVYGKYRSSIGQLFVQHSPVRSLCNTPVYPLRITTGI